MIKLERWTQPYFILIGLCFLRDIFYIMITISRLLLKLRFFFFPCSNCLILTLIPFSLSPLLFYQEGTEDGER